MLKKKKEDRQKTKIKQADKMAVYLLSGNLEHSPLPEEQLQDKSVGEV